MEEHEALTKLAAAIRRLLKLSTEIASGNLDKRKAFLSTRDKAYSMVHWINAEAGRIEWNDRIEAVSFTQAVAAGEAVVEAERSAKISQLTAEIREEKRRRKILHGY